MLTRHVVPALAYPSSLTWYVVAFPNPLACPCVVYTVISCPTGSSLWCFSHFPASSSGLPAQFYLCPLCFHHSMHLGSQPHFHVFWPPTIGGELPERYQCLAQSWGLYKYLLSWAWGSTCKEATYSVLSFYFPHLLYQWKFQVAQVRGSANTLFPLASVVLGRAWKCQQSWVEVWWQGISRADVYFKTT